MQHILSHESNIIHVFVCTNVYNNFYDFVFQYNKIRITKIDSVFSISWIGFWLLTTICNPFKIFILYTTEVIMFDIIYSNKGHISWKYSKLKLLNELTWP